MKFNSAMLQARFEEAKSALENFNPTQDLITDDIKELETFLKTASINHSISYSFKSTALPAHHEELLMWNHITKQIIYIHNAYGISCVSDMLRYYPRVNYNDKETLTEKPLLEMPYEVRKRLWEDNKLASFLSYIVERIHLKEHLS